MHYMIHTCPQREWYVYDYLIPSMREQGIRDCITIAGDVHHRGHLQSFVDSIAFLSNRGGTWHLQDDVIISSKFKEMTEKHTQGVVCGFCNRYSKDKDYSGWVDVSKMWYSMPCIYIPNHKLKEFRDWLKKDETYLKYKPYMDDNKHSDVLFWSFLKERYADEKVLNLVPNIVNHVDHLIGGSVLNSTRAQDTDYIMSVHWREPELVEQLAEKLRNERVGYTDSKDNDI